MSSIESVGAQAVTQSIQNAKARSEPALVAFLTAGYPRKETFLTDLYNIASVVDVVEIGVPFSDPMADGMTIQRSSQRALENGVTLSWILETLTSAPKAPPVPLLLMSYLNPLLSYGLDRLPSAMKKANVSGVIVPDLSLEESDDLKAALNSQGLGLVQLVSPVTPLERMKQIVSRSDGFVYAVTLTGTTGKKTADPKLVEDYLKNIKAHSPVPVCAGFGIRQASQVSALAGMADGVIVGSALIEAIEQGIDPVEFLKGLRLQS